MLARLKEPSTYAGIASVISGVGTILKDDNTTAIAGAIVEASPHIISGNWMGAGMIFFGLFAMFIKEKKQ